MSDAFPTFAVDGTLLGNLTSDQGTIPAVPPVPSIGGSAKNGGISISDAAATAGITGGSIPPASTTGNANSGAQLNSWFTRAVVVILGFVFVAVGLSQFGVVQRGLGPR